MVGYKKILATNYSKERSKYVYTDKDLFLVMEGMGIKDKTILDFGCGDGIHAFELARRKAKKIIGIDLSEQMINLAQNRLQKDNFTNLNFLLADGSQLPFENEVFDIVLANYSLVHFQDIGKPLAEIYRVLKPGGSLVATINNAEFSDQALVVSPIPLKLGGEDGVVVYDYLRTDQETQAALEKYGFKINVYRSLDNQDAVIDSSFQNLDKVNNFHCVLFSGEKINSL